jgi:alpha-mannosidase
VQGGRHPTEAKRIEAPEYIDIDSPQGRTSLLTGGLPYHRRSAMRIVDSLLVVRGETARRFSLAIGIDVSNPAAAAADLIAPQTVLAQTAAPLAGPASGWLFHIDSRSVIATHWAPLGPAADAVEPPAQSQPSGPRGFRVRLLETSGRPVRATLRAFRALSRAAKVDFRGQALSELTVEEDRIVVDLAAHEWAEVEACW